jgi:hypothetical protein
MRRHRVFVAGSAAPPEKSGGTPYAASDDEDIPLLTEIVDPVAEPPISGPSIQPEDLQRWLDEELPTAVLTVLDGVTDRLVEVLTQKIKRELLEPAIAPRDAS